MVTFAAYKQLSLEQIQAETLNHSYVHETCNSSARSLEIWSRKDRHGQSTTANFKHLKQRQNMPTGKESHRADIFTNAALSFNPRFWGSTTMAQCNSSSSCTDGQIIISHEDQLGLFMDESGHGNADELIPGRPCQNQKKKKKKLGLFYAQDFSMMMGCYQVLA